MWVTNFSINATGIEEKKKKKVKRGREREAKEKNAEKRQKIYDKYRIGRSNL